MSEARCHPAGDADLPAVAAMYDQLDRHFRSLSYSFPEVDHPGELWVDSFRRTLGRFSILYLAELEGEPCGFSLGRVKRVAPYLGGVLVGELSDIYVAPQARRLGIGEELASMTFDWLRSQGVHSVEVQILEGNQASFEFFRSLGFLPELRQYRLTWEGAAHE